jgi:hypothetical protein
MCDVLAKDVMFVYHDLLKLIFTACSFHGHRMPNRGFLKDIFNRKNVDLLILYILRLQPDVCCVTERSCFKIDGDEKIIYSLLRILRASLSIESM